ncbi:MAG: cytoplasmic protein [Nitrospirae bacterium]|nr:MAG: cytoplasmic protein [Nitrospirota bacterium]
MRPGRPAEPPQEQFRSFKASALYCPQCRQATPVHERLLLVLPDGNLYEYRCVHCGTSTGSKTEKEQKGLGIP